MEDTRIDASVIIELVHQISDISEDQAKAYIENIYIPTIKAMALSGDRLNYRMDNDTKTVTCDTFNISDYGFLSKQVVIDFRLGSIAVKYIHTSTVNTVTENTALEIRFGKYDANKSAYLRAVRRRSAIMSRVLFEPDVEMTVS